MDITKIKVIGGPLVLSTDAEVTELETKLGVTFPEGYRKYITTLGEGILGGDLVRVYPPWRVAKQLDSWRERIQEYWFWDAGRDSLSKQQALECIIVGDTANGDELIFHPSRIDRLLVLPRDSEEIFEVGSNLLDAVEWMCGSGKLVRRFKQRNFEPFDTRMAH